MRIFTSQSLGVIGGGHNFVPARAVGEMIIPPILIMSPIRAGGEKNDVLKVP